MHGRKRPRCYAQAWWSNLEGKETWELALDLLDRLTGVDYHVLNFDTGYGECRDFLKALDEREDKFVAQIPESHGFWPLDIGLNEEDLKQRRKRHYPEIKDHHQKALSAKKWGERLEAHRTWQTITLPLKTPKEVKACEVELWETTSGAYYRPGPKRRLIIPKNEDGEIKYFVTSLKKTIPLEQVILWANERWKVEQGYKQLKQESGLDHFEGRSWNGLHHRLILCLMAYIFLMVVKKMEANHRITDLTKSP